MVSHYQSHDSASSRQLCSVTCSPQDAWHWKFPSKCIGSVHLLGELAIPAFQLATPTVSAVPVGSCPSWEQGLLTPWVALHSTPQCWMDFPPQQLQPEFLLAEASGSDKWISPSACRNQILEKNPVPCPFRRKGPAAWCMMAWA